METRGGFFFQNGSPVATEHAKELLSALAKEIGRMPNHLLIEGHTDSTPYASDDKYSNWELSADRANSARHVMEQSGIRADQTSYVRGCADRQLKNPANPSDPSNRRVSLVIQYQDAPVEQAKADEKPAAAKAVSHK